MSLASRPQKTGKNRLGPWFGMASLGLVLQLVSGCLYDGDAPCGPGQLAYGDNARCVCPARSAYTPTGCVACGEHEVPTPSSGCTCEPSFIRNETTHACEPMPVGLGAACDPAAPICNAPYDHCEPAGASGYCTKTGCKSSDDCENNYGCSAAGVCQRPPTGLSKACTSDADCAGTEATYCDTFVTHSCLVQGCTLAPDNCFAGFECCDLSSYGIAQPLCIAAGACTT
jgi:hypothetical protein